MSSAFRCFCSIILFQRTFLIYLFIYRRKMAAKFLPFIFWPWGIPHHWNKAWAAQPVGGLAMFILSLAPEGRAPIGLLGHVLWSLSSFSALRGCILMSLSQIRWLTPSSYWFRQVDVMDFWPRRHERKSCGAVSSLLPLTLELAFEYMHIF